MRSWRACLDAAALTSRSVRSDYAAAGRFLQRREPALYTAMRLLGPPAFQPHALAGYAFGCLTDDVGDHGAPPQRMRRFDRWTHQVRHALETGSSPHPLVRAFLHSRELRGLPPAWVDRYLLGARIDLDFRGFATEADYQDYIDRLSWPFIMLTTGLLHVGGGDERWARTCRTLADACQRTDILTDIEEDLRQGRLYLPAETLDRHGVRREDLERGRHTPGLRTLIADMAGTAHRTLADAADLLRQMPGPHRPLNRFALRLHHVRLDAVVAMGPAITRRPFRDDVGTCLRLLCTARRPEAIEAAPSVSVSG